ncbi:MAG: ectonucleotide pyrophosphatase/phosphodiesterase [Burkholderiaceae bacterium]|nr:ectonucleotide pyrophosphatase/phosphodiesterase [Burkholderiaceae bacterium]
MHKYIEKLSALLALTLTALCVQAAEPPLILVSIDGFRPDYLNRGVTPNLNRLAAAGARAEAMRPSFPSITYPNHYTLVTGMRPDHHGLVDNVMSDASIPGVQFKLGTDAVTDRRWWDQAEPVWVTAQRAGIRSAVLFWPGAEAAIHGVRPAMAPHYDGSMAAMQRADTLLSWLDQVPAQRFGFLALYFEDVDHAGHTFGPEAAQTTQAVALVDQAIGRLLDGLSGRGIDANLVIVSDHGMTPVSAERVIRMDALAPQGSYRAVTNGPYAAMEATPGQEAQLAAALLQPQQHMQCWRKAGIPARLAYGRNARVPGFFCLADPGWFIAFDDGAAARVKGGKHGYDNAAPDMAALFIAVGPAFKPGVVLPVFDNVDVYPLLMGLLGVPPLPSDGTITSLLPALLPKK